jgi:uncharacterized protein (DUF342 family)
MGVHPGDESCWDLCCEPAGASHAPHKHVEFVDDASHRAHQKKKNKLTKELTDVENTQQVLDNRFTRNTEELLHTLDEEKKETETEIAKIKKERKHLEEQVWEWKKHRDQYEDTVVKEVRQKRFCNTGCPIH